MKVYSTSILLALLSSVAVFQPVAAKKKKCFAQLGEDNDSGRKTRFLKSKPGKIEKGDLDADCDEADETSIILLNGKTATFTQDHSSQGEAGHWYGENDIGTFEFISTGDTITGTLVDLDDDLVYTLHRGENGEQVIEAHPNSEFLEEGHAHDEDMDWEAMEADGGNRALKSSKLRGGSSLLNIDEEEVKQRALNGINIIDMMIVWTKAAECQLSGYDATCTPNSSTYDRMMDEANLAIAVSNTAYTKSEINAQLRLVHAYRHEKFEEGENRNVGPSSSKQLEMITNNQGDFNDIHGNRDTYGADMVALINNRYDYCGIAWRSSGPWSSSMFSVTNYRCGTSYFTFPHEVGHNMGFNHDMGVNRACDSSSGNYGYRDPDMRFRTIMSYSCTYDRNDGNDYQCDINDGASGSCGRVQHFSNPDVMYAGRTTGIKNKADNAKHLNNVAYRISQFKPTRVGTTPGSTTPTTTTTTTEPTTTTRAATTTTEEPTTTTVAPTTPSSSGGCSGGMTYSKKVELDDTIERLISSDLMDEDDGEKALKQNNGMWNQFKKGKYDKAIKKIKNVIKQIKKKADSSNLRDVALDHADCILNTLETY